MNTNMRQLKDTITQSINEPLPRITAKIKCSFVAHFLKLCISLAMVLFVFFLNSVPSYGAELISTSSAIRSRSLTSVLRSSSPTFEWHNNSSIDNPCYITNDNSYFVYIDSTSDCPSPSYIVGGVHEESSSDYSVFVISLANLIDPDSHVYFSWLSTMGVLNPQPIYYTSSYGIYYCGKSRGPSDANIPYYNSSEELFSAASQFLNNNTPSSASVHWTDGSVLTPLFSTDSPTFTVSSSVADPAYVLVGSLGYNGTNSSCIVASTSTYVNPSSTCDLSDGRSLTLSFERDYGGYHFYFRLPGFNGDFGLNPDFPYFESQDAAFAAFAEFLDSQIPFSNYSLPNGNVLYLDIGSGNSFSLNLETIMPDTSAILGSPWADSQYYFWSDSLPSNTSFSADDGTYITWVKSSTDRNILGQTKTAVSDLSGIASSRYLVIVNPLIYAQATNKFNGSVKVSSIPSGTTIYSYPLNAYLSDGVYVNDVSSNGGTGTAVSSGGNINTVSIDDSTVDYSAPSGGLNWQESSQSIAEDVRGLKESLSDFFNNVLTLLGKPVGYIQQLIGAGSSFMQHISGLWSWLPSDVSSVLTSSLIVMVGVAVFKVFL